MKAVVILCLSAGVLAGCADLDLLSVGPEPEPAPASLVPVNTPTADTPRPLARPSNLIPDVIPETAQSGELGRSVVSLGNPADQSLWVETPLVSQVQNGRVIRTDTGAELAVQLRPGPEGGARASLQTLLGLGLSPAALSELVIASP